MTYAYEPLDLTKHSIRLLNILPAADGDVISLSLHVYDGEDVKGDYDAISYEWGSAFATALVLVNGTPMRIRDNIWRFLTHCRDTKFAAHHHRNLWIDAICIDQDNVSEKNHQVMQMSKIFREARQVIAWLGWASESTALPQDADERLATEYPSVPQAPISPVSFDSSSTWDSESALAYLRPTTRDIKDVEDDMRSLLDDTYWGRLWIMQELRLARRAIVVTGTGFVEIALLRNLARMIRADRCPHLYLEGAQLDLVRFAASPVSSGEDLVSLAEGCRNLQCSELLDKVYGLLGMAEDGHLFEVDYSLGSAELLLRVLQFMLWHRDDMVCHATMMLPFLFALELKPGPLVASTPVTEETLRPDYRLALMNPTTAAPGATRPDLRVRAGDSFHLRVDTHIGALYIDESGCSLLRKDPLTKPQMKTPLPYLSVHTKSARASLMEWAPTVVERQYEKSRSETAFFLPCSYMALIELQEATPSRDANFY